VGRCQKHASRPQKRLAKAPQRPFSPLRKPVHGPPTPVCGPLASVHCSRRSVSPPFFSDKALSAPFYSFGISRIVFLIYYKRSEFPEAIFRLVTNARNYPKDRKLMYHLFGKVRLTKNIDSHFSEESEKLEIRYTAFREYPINIKIYFYAFGDFRRVESI